jgi:diacylglycerol kinase (ATP)
MEAGAGDRVIGEDATGRRARKTDLGPDTRWCALHNPAAGSAEKLHELTEHLGRLGHVELVETRGPGDGSRRAREAVERGFDHILSLGGDGMLSEVVNGLGEGLSATVAVLPLGTGNDFARSLGIPEDPLQAIDVLARGATRKVDVLRIDSCGKTEYAINASAGGFTAIVDEKLEETDKQTLGKLAYAVSCGKALPELTAYRLRLEVDGVPRNEIDAYNFTVSNGRYIGGGLPIAPAASLTDGRMDVVVLPSLSAPKLALILGKAWLGVHWEDEDLVCLQARRLRVECEPVVAFNRDGEVVGTTPVDYRVLPAALEVVVGVEA